jgi:PiT family inorganic phosphate transporter
VASGSVIGTGIGRKGASVRWRTAGRIGLGWLITIPASGLVGALATWVALTGPVGIIADAVVGGAIILAIFVYSRKNRVDSRHVTGVEPTVFVRPKTRKGKGKGKAAAEGPVT